MKQICFCLAILSSLTGYSQEKDNKISTVFTLAVKEAQGWDIYRPTTPDFTFYNRNFSSLFRQSNLTSDILDRRMNMLYVDNDRLYSNTYVPITLQQHHSNLAVDNFYRNEKMYALPDKVPGSK
ncbi:MULTISPECIES: hypothetical protein [Flavobacterium]|uniref:Uncharacterized protein n=1 Tax=Flavobacterium suzhouense TaxID=1529638 RepID=A0ABW5NY93_9FLAO|nr:hypothetical protein [Flavobacterium sp. AG291]RDI13283.1 hypothetical protein DEU42_103194 [Flavobacterium sp. AG291]